MKTLLILTINFYQGLSHLFLPKGVCRFRPTCSDYTKESIKKYGFKGLLLSLKRFLNCRPGLPFSYDPVPESLNIKKHAIL